MSLARHAAQEDSVTGDPILSLSVEQRFSKVVHGLCESQKHHVLYSRHSLCRHLMPSRDDVHQIITGLRDVLFPGYFGLPGLDAESLEYHVGSTLHGVQRLLTEQITRGLCFVCSNDHQHEHAACQSRADELMWRFMARLPHIQHTLLSDVHAAFDGDPAATSPDEVVYCYPGIIAIASHRIAHELYKLKVPIIPRMIAEESHSTTGIDIHPGATIGEKFFIDHGTGVVIGETSVIGKRVRIYQGVTLGAKSFATDRNGNPIKGMKRHPNVEDDVVIYSGATILGNITVGAGSVIGGNVWLTRSVPPGSTIRQVPFRTTTYEDGGGI